MMHSSDLKDINLEQALFNARILALLILILGLVVLLAWRMFELQVAQHSHYTTLSRHNSLRLRPLPPTRGLIYARQGELIADNRPTFRLELVPAEVDNLANTLQRLSHILTLSDDEIARFQKQRSRSLPTAAVPLKLNLSEAEVARFHLEKRHFPGVRLSTANTRVYPAGAALAHVLGYVGRINEQDLQRIVAANYQGTTHIGKTGIERYYETQLHGITGVARDEVDAQGRRIRTLEQQAPRMGRSLVLSIDLELQRLARSLLSEQSGAIVAMDPRNGEILALVSAPDFDPNLFVGGISYKAYAKLRDNPERPLFNRVLQGQYPPGSTIKPLTGLAGLEAQTIDFHQKMFAAGYYQIPNDARKYRDWRAGGHGWIDMDAAIAQSSDVYFYDLAYQLGIDTLSPFYARFGLGRKTGVDLPGEARGLIPSRGWKRGRYKQPWFPGDTLITGIGQGYMLATPLQLAKMTSCIAMRGRCPLPTLRKHPHPDAEPAQTQTPTITLKDPAHWDDIITAMEHVMQAPNGTAHASGADAAYRIAGKTGTSQVFGLKEGQKYDADTLPRKLRDHALFIGFAPVEAPRIAVAVVVEHGGHGSSAAAPKARQLMDAWLQRPLSAQHPDNDVQP